MDFAEQKVLELSEKILSALGDGSIYMKYLKIKEKAVSMSPGRVNLDVHLKRLALENRELNRKIAEVKATENSNETLENYVIGSLVQMRKDTLPDAKVPPPISLNDACEALIAIIDAKSESNMLLRQKYTNENSILRDKISNIQKSSTEELQKIHQRHIDIDHKSRAHQKKITDSYTRLTEEMKNLIVQIENIEEENAGIEDSINSYENQAKVLAQRLSEAESKRGMTKSRLIGLQKKANLLRSDFENKSQLIESKRAAQRFGTSDADPKEVEELKDLEAKIAKLAEENELMQLELKKKKLSSSDNETTLFSNTTLINV